MIDHYKMIHPTVSIHPTAVISPAVKIGAGTYIGPFCIIGYPAEHKGYWGNVPRRSEVIIGENCVITGHVTIDGSTDGVTAIGNNVWMMKHSHVGHDAVICDNVVISCGAKIGGHAAIGEGTNIGLNAVIHQWKQVPPGCMIGANAFIGKELPMIDGGVYVGVPAKFLKMNEKWIMKNGL